MTATPLWFGPSERPLFGWVHVPEGGRACGAVVLCPPLARELTSTQYCYRLLAEALTRAGMLTVRFDYDGTGDSAGGDFDPHRVESWLASIGHAVDLARSCGPRAVSLVGMRVGALLAAVEAARLGSVDAVVLWDPCGSARSFVREQMALQRIRSDVYRDPGEDTELPGFVFSTETVNDLGSLAIPAASAAPDRVLLLTRPDAPAATELVAALGTAAQEGEAAEQEQLLEVEPLYHQIPHQTIEHIVSWLESGNRAESSPVSVVVRDTAPVPFDGHLLTERILRLGPLGLFGVATEPEVPASAPTILMLNCGNDWHVGPNRLWVDLSRRWAAAGFRCVRFDESGLGDSPVRPGQEPHVIRAPEAFDDVADAAAALEPDDPTNVILVGLCSGGYQALENALARAPRAVYAVNPILHFDPPELAAGAMDPRRRICHPTTSFVRAYRWLPIGGLRRRVRKLAWRVAHLLNRGRDPSNWLGQLRDDGVEVLVICGRDEARPFGSPNEENTGRRVGRGHIRLEVIDDLDHALMPAWQRLEVTRRMTDHLLGHFVLEHAPAVPRRDPD
jgi:alpha-beta hydrolase superfamily lysophospholipase